MKSTNLVWAKDYSLRQACLLDAPFIFNLMMNGSEIGAFADRYMVGTGGFNLLLFILYGLFRQINWRCTTGRQSEWMLVFKSESLIGFMKVDNLDFFDEKAEKLKLLALFAIAPRYRQQGHVTAVLKMFIDAQPDETKLIVHCTKYARAMQHILKKLRFTRNPKAGKNLEEYRFTKRAQPL